MNIHELHEIHKALWSKSSSDTVTYRGRNYKMSRIDQPGKLFKRVVVGNRLIITQNMRKQSRWTLWVKQNPNSKLTWIIKDNKYFGRVSTVEENNKCITRFFLLNPDREIDSIIEPR